MKLEALINKKEKRIETKHDVHFYIGFLVVPSIIGCLNFILKDVTLERTTDIESLYKLFSCHTTCFLLFT